MGLEAVTPASDGSSGRPAAGRWPWVSVVIVAGLLLVQLLPALGDALLYDRDAIVRGEPWRFATGHWVHYSWAHLWGNVAVVAVAGCWAEQWGSRDVVRVVAIASLAISGALWAFEPGILQFAGASGLAVALTVYAACCAWRDGGRSRRVGGIVLAVVGVKLLAESAGWQWRDWADDGFVPVGLSHAAGAVAGWLLAVLPGGRTTAEPRRTRCRTSSGGA